MWILTIRQFIEVIGDDIWYLHSSDNPVSQIRMFKCPSNEVCQMQDNEYAFITAKKQEFNQTNGNTTANSQIFYKNTKYFWINANEFGFNLNNGQPWGESTQCLSHNCRSGKCRGLDSGKGCFQHSDWDAGLACISDTSFPYLTTWQTWKTSGTCTNDYDCDPRYFWWYADASAVTSSTKTCLQKFSQSNGTTFGWSSTQSDAALDGLQNGKYCSSGFARESTTNTATCMTITQISSNLGVQTSPYQCTATDTTNTCDYYYDSSNFVSAQCQWSLDGTSGYWPVPGQDELNTYVTYMREFDAINNCHTLDRNDYRRLQNNWAVTSSTANQHWQNAAGISFNITFWPFLQGTSVSDCMQEVFYLSVSNLQKSYSYLNNKIIYLPILVVLLIFSAM